MKYLADLLAPIVSVIVLILIIGTAWLVCCHGPELDAAATRFLNGAFQE